MGPELIQPEAISRLSIPGSDYTQVSAGSDHTCALREDGVVECWGDNGFGKAPSTRAAATGTFSQVSAGGLHTCALRSDGVVECWGNTGAGQAPGTRAPADGAFVQIDAGNDHTCGLRNDGIVECWGNNNLGKAPSLKTAIAAAFVQVTAGYTHSCGTRSDGVAECWGSSGSGQAPATVTPSAGTFTQASGGSLHTCARRNDGVVECWGDNAGGRAPALKSAASGGFDQVASGVSHTCAVRTDGVVECWGSNLSGKAPATKTAAEGAFSQVSTGANHTCAIRTDGAVECWGADFDGQAPATRRASTGSTTVLPIATFRAPAVVGEGSSVDLSLSDAEVPGYDGAPFSYAFDCGSGYGTFSTQTTASCDAPDGPSTLEAGGIVRDRDGDEREYRASITVENVAPTVAVLTGAALLVGEAYLENGGFTDPGEDAHEATVDYGDGGGAESLPLVGTAFSLAHTFSTSGTFTVAVAVTDSDGETGGQSATVTVMSVGDFLDHISSGLDELKRSVLGRGRAPRLINELRRVDRYLSRGDLDSALASLDDFVGMLEALAEEGTLSAAQAAAFIEDADRVRQAIQSLA